MMTEGAASYQWHSWHLHGVSLDPAELDRLLTEVIGPVVEGLADAGRSPMWFFIRYWLHGPHLRLRIAGLDADGADSVERDIASLLAKAVSSSAVPADDAGYQRAAALIAAAGEAGSPIDPGHLRPSGVYRERYEPEWERYGGAALMPDSERLFHASSTTALRICRDRDPGEGTMGLGLQALAVGCGALRTDPVGFLITTRDLWSQWLAAGRPGVDAAAIDRAARKDAARLASARPSLRAAVDGACPARWQPWMYAVHTAMRAWRRALDPPAVRRVFGSHLHMMENRLGVKAGAEAYLAAVLLHLLTDLPAGTGACRVSREAKQRRVGAGLKPAARVQAGHYLGNVPAAGAHRDPEHPGDGLVLGAFCQQLEYLALQSVPDDITGLRRHAAGLRRGPVGLCQRRGTRPGEIDQVTQETDQELLGDDGSGRLLCCGQRRGPVRGEHRYARHRPHPDLAACRRPLHCPGGLVDKTPEQNPDTASPGHCGTDERGNGHRPAPSCLVARYDHRHLALGRTYQLLDDAQGGGMPWLREDRSHRWCVGKLLSGRFQRLRERICLLRQAG